MRRLDRALYPLFAAACTLVAARTFYGYMLVQTGGEWSAPLDDVFIHFDYARATALGHPFEWVPGNGYSSGNTSLLYPFVLAPFWAAGLRAQALMIGAGIVACTSLFGLLLAARRLFSGLPRWTKYLAPPCLFAVGALDWSFFSGMEVAFFLGTWAIAFVATHDLVERARARWPIEGAGWCLGLAGVLVVATRPEGATSIAVLGLAGAAVVLRERGAREALATLVRAGAPCVVALLVQSLANRTLTGEWTANGAIVKLLSYHPFMTAEQKQGEWRFLREYVVDRLLEHHFTEDKPWGRVLPLLAAVPLLSSRTRLYATVLWASALAWLPVVALNAQVRWQNERYVMPAVAWGLLAAAMGLALLFEPRFDGRRRWLRGASLLARAGAGAFAIHAYVVHHAPQMRDQIWFFGRASRNIRDQHVRAGRRLRELVPRPRRVMVGDAGALLYASELPGLDLIGLGGLHDLPFARAGVHGLGATLELVERLPPADRPDVMAIYPSWWGELPVWFGKRLFEVPIEGNVICGGAEDVVYRADWSALGTGVAPRTLGASERVVDEIDVADLVSERSHGYVFPHPAAGFVETKLLPDPEARGRDLFDAGRRIPPGRAESMHAHVAPDAAARLVVRAAPEHDVEVAVRIDGARVGALRFTRQDGWQEQTIELPPARKGPDVAIELEPLAGGKDWVDYHVWIVQPR